MKHGGDLVALVEASGLPESAVVDASANLNPLGPPDWLDAAFAEGRRLSGRYPDPLYRDLRAVAAERLGVPDDRVAFGNGADELMYAIARAARRRASGNASAPASAPVPKPAAVIEGPAYASYRDASEAAGLTVSFVPAALPSPADAPEADAPEAGMNGTNPLSAAESALDDCAPGSILWLGAPNNPTGLMPADYPASVVELARRHPDRLVVCDEAFIEFCPGDGETPPASAVEAAAAADNLIVVRSMTKFWAVPGLRAGYVVGSKELIAAIRDELPNWPLGSVAEAFARRALSDPAAAERRLATVRLVSDERRRMAAMIGALPGLTPLRSLANYYLVRVDAGLAGLPASDLADRLAAMGVGVRRCGNYDGLSDDYLRVAVRSPKENDAIAAAFASALRGGAPARPGPRAAGRRAKALMIQGCSSGAGKSLVAAAFCRIFRDEGYDVAPYKAQNMSLNSAVTPDGLEIGRAQAVQAAACGLEPDARMNPVLLKPESDTGSQVVLLGRPYARRSARDYYATHAELSAAARRAYDELASERELIVLEGAGSPAEINLKIRDFVNMNAAIHAGARVLLVGDIDRGGVFASFIGHVATFSPAELGLLSGFVVNKFRGDPALLGDAFAMTRDRTGYPVLGCVPMIRGLAIPDEDEPIVKAGRRPGAELRIAVPRLRRVSNFTDLDAFAIEPDVEIVPVSSSEEFDHGRFDAVIIPGSKSTVDDLGWLRASGLAETIVRFAASGGAVAGICGGYQMLGLTLLDPDGVESPSRETPGLGLLPVVTSFAADKTLSRSSARWAGSGLPEARDAALVGYEIHHGATRPVDTASAEPDGGAAPVILSDDGEPLGYGSGRVWGGYLHGVFDADGFRRAFLNELRARKGLAPLPPNSGPSLDAELSRLAEAVRANVDLSYIRAELGL